MTSTVNDKPNVFMLMWCWCYCFCWSNMSTFFSYFFYFFVFLFIYICVLCSPLHSPFSLVFHHHTLYSLWHKKKNNITQTRKKRKKNSHSLNSNPLHPVICLTHFVIIFSYLHCRLFFSASSSSSSLDLVISFPTLGLHCCALLSFFFHSIRFTFYKYIESDKDEAQQRNKINERNHS